MSRECTIYLWREGLPPKDGKKYLVVLKSNDIAIMYWRGGKGLVNWYDGWRYYKDDVIAFWTDIIMPGYYNTELLGKRTK